MSVSLTTNCGIFAESKNHDAREDELVFAVESMPIETSCNNIRELLEVVFFVLSVQRLCNAERSTVKAQNRRCMCNGHCAATKQCSCKFYKCALNMVVNRKSSVITGVGSGIFFWIELLDFFCFTLSYLNPVDG